MKRTFLFSLIFLIISSFSLTKNAYSEEIEIMPEIFDEEVTGIIEEVNYDTSTLIIKSYINDNMDDYREYDFYVLEEAVIEKDGQVINFEDLFPEDTVTVRYRETTDGRKEVDHIWVNKE